MPTAPSEPAPTPTRAVAAFACLALGMTPALHPAIRATIPQITPAAPLLTALLLALIALRTPPRARTSLLALAAIALGLGWATLRTTHPPRDFLGARIDPASPHSATTRRCGAGTRGWGWWCRGGEGAARRLYAPAAAGHRGLES